MKDIKIAILVSIIASLLYDTLKKILHQKPKSRSSRKYSKEY